MNRPFLLFLITALSLSCNKKEPTDENTTNTRGEHNTYFIKDVHIIPMTEGDEVIPHATVVITDKKIVAITDSVPEKATVIDGTGKWLIPGLIDMHVHNLADINFSENYPTKGATMFTDTDRFMLLYVANGVTTVLELSGRVEHFGQRNEIVRGTALGPRIALAMLIDGGTSGHSANTPEQGRQTVRIAKAQGYDFIKVYSHLSADTYYAIVDEADNLNMKVIGHIPDVFEKSNLHEAFVPNFQMVAHAEEFAKKAKTFSEEEALEFARMAKKSGVWLTPTLTVMERMAQQTVSLDSVHYLKSFKYVHPLMQNKWITSNNNFKNTSPEKTARFKKLAEYNKVLVRAFNDTGVPIVAGTDAGSSGVVWGFSLHDELELLVEAGLTNQEALVSATRLPAEWLGISDMIGTIESGNFADLVLLDANPLVDIKNARAIHGVFFNGNWLDREDMDSMLSDLADWNTARKGKEKYQWENRRNY